MEKDLLEGAIKGFKEVRAHGEEGEVVTFKKVFENREGFSIEVGTTGITELYGEFAYIGIRKINRDYISCEVSDDGVLRDIQFSLRGYDARRLLKDTLEFASEVVKGQCNGKLETERFKFTDPQKNERLDDWMTRCIERIKGLPNYSDMEAARKILVRKVQEAVVFRSHDILG